MTHSPPLRGFDAHRDGGSLRGLQQPLESGTIKPPDFEDDNREIIIAAAAGHAPAFHRPLQRDPTLSRRGYSSTSPIHFAVREGHSEIHQMRLDAEADSERNGCHGEGLVEANRSDERLIESLGS